MTVINSAGTGDWHTPATWVGGVVPGTGDTANVLTGHTVTIAAELTAITKIVVTGNLVMNADITMDNTNGCFIAISNGGTFTSNGTPSSNRKIQQASGGLVNSMWYFSVRNDPNVARRTINLDNITMSGNWWYLGKSPSTNEYIEFNLKGSSSMVMLRPSPIVRDISMNEHLIDGRSMGRIYPRAKAAGRCTIKGYIQRNIPYYIYKMENLKSLNARVSLITDITHMGQARVESLRWGEVKGNILPFTIVLVEDL